MEQLRNCIAEQVDIRKDSLTTILSAFEPKEIMKGQFFLESGKICRKMAFIESGYLRMYDIADGKEITFWIGSSGKFITSLSSFVFETSNFWNIQAVTDCQLYEIDRQKHFELCRTQPQWLRV